MRSDAPTRAANTDEFESKSDPARIEDVPDGIRNFDAAVLDTGTLPGTPSTVIDLTGREPQVLREGAVAADEARARIARVAAE